MLLALSLQNFKKHEDLRVEFKRGLNGIFGPNYKGKSSILYGILYALGGATQVPGTRLARRGSDGRFTVELHMLLADTEYKVVRTKSTANLYRFNATNLSPDNSAEPDGWGVIATGTTGVNEEIEKLIGMPVKQWKELHFAKQKNAHSLLRYSATNLHQLMRRLVGAEELDQVQTRLKRMAVKEEGVLQALGNEVHDIEECRARLAEDQEKVAKAKTLAEGLKAEVSQLAEVEQQGLAAITKNSDRLTVLQEQKTKVSTHTSRLEAAELGLAQAREQLAERSAAVKTSLAQEQEAAALVDPEATGKIALRIELMNKAHAASEQQSFAKGKLEKAENKLASATRSFANASLELQKFEEEHGDISADLATARSASVTASEAVAIARKRCEDLETAAGGAACPTCQRPFEGHDPAKLAAELEQAQEILATTRATLTSSQEKVAGLENLAVRLEHLSKEVRSAEQAMSAADEDLVAAKGDVADANDAVDGIAGDLNDLGISPEWVEEQQRLSQRLATAKQAHKAAKAELERAERAVGPAEQALAKIKADGPTLSLADIEAEIAKKTETLRKDRLTLVELREALAEKRAEAEKAASDLSGHEQMVVTWQGKLQSAEKSSAQREVAEKRLARITHLQKHLRTNAETYMNSVWASFMLQASRFAAQCTGGDIERLERTEDGAFVFLEDGEEMQLEEASGAQEAIIGLAVQIALGQSAPCHLHTVLLDEPTADMDPDCSLATMVAMKALGVQVVFVSHNQTDNSLCDQAITL